MRYFQGIALELALLAAGHKFPRLSEVGAAWGEDVGGPTRVDLEPPTEKPVRVDVGTRGPTIFLLDITLTRDGKIHLIEANGSNAALSSSVVGKDDRRAKHMFVAYRSKAKPRGSVAVLLAYAPSLLHMAEFFGRAGIFAELVSEDQTVRLCNTVENLGDEEVSIVCDEIPLLANHVTRSGSQLFFKGRPVDFAANPNLLAELVRREIIGRDSSGGYDIDYSIYHEGICVPVVHDKGLQQQVAQGTGIAPLRTESASSRSECLDVIADYHRAGTVCVGKMNAGSGGAGIAFFPPTLSAAEIDARLNDLFGNAESKYGGDVNRTIFPVRFFEFARSTDYDLYGNKHLWDMRMQCLVYPGYVDVTPCVIRLCPKPFDDITYDWDSVVSNLTGRAPTGRFMRSPAAMRRSKPESVLQSIGVDSAKLYEMIVACGRWCESAWVYSEATFSKRQQHAVVTTAGTAVAPLSDQG